MLIRQASVLRSSPESLPYMPSGCRRFRAGKMKHFFIFFLLIHLIGCSSHSQIQKGELKIEKKMINKFSEGPNPGTHSGSDKIYIDNILVDSTDSSKEIQDYINADIRESKGNHFPFDTCKCFLNNDTLQIQFSETTTDYSDFIKVKIADKKYVIYYEFNNLRKPILATHQSLIFKEEVYKRGQCILGEIVFQILNPESSKQYFFSGPFTCSLE